jgi:hypothetical protein
MASIIVESFIIIRSMCVVIIIIWRDALIIIVVFVVVVDVVLDVARMPSYVPAFMNHTIIVTVVRAARMFKTSSGRKRLSSQAPFMDLRGRGHRRRKVCYEGREEFFLQVGLAIRKARFLVCTTVIMHVEFEMYWERAALDLFLAGLVKSI